MQSIAPTLSEKAEGNLSNVEYDAFLGRVNARFQANRVISQLFTTTASPDELWAAYLNGFEDPAERQYHNCNCCRHFIQRFGGLVVISDAGDAISAMWNLDDTPEHYKKAIANMVKVVDKARVDGVFFTNEVVMGTYETGVWHHLHLKVPADMRHTDKLKTPYQSMAVKLEDFKNIRRALGELSFDHLQQALTLLGTEALYRSEKVIGPVQFLHDLKLLDSDTNIPKPKRHNMLWKSIATAPNGFLHPRASMAWSLLEDLMAGLPYNSIAARFKAKMRPDVYQTPQAAPTVGNIKRGEEIIAKLGLERSLERRFARLEELPTLWTPKKPAEQPSTGGVFGHLKAKDSPAKPVAMNVPATNITFDKLRRQHLPNAEKMEVFLYNTKQAFMAFVTAEHADAPPILQWDDPEARNPVSVYTYTQGSLPSQWGLSSGKFHEVTGIVLRPHMFGGEEKYANHSKGAVLILEGCVDTQEGQGNALFPQTLISDLHEIRSTIEAYSRNAELGGRSQATACGIGLNAGQGYKVHVRLTINNQMVEYMIDRWD